MTSLTTFYLSRLTGCTVFDARENVLGKIADVYVQQPRSTDSSDVSKPRVVGYRVKTAGKTRAVQLNEFQIIKFGIHYKVQCTSLTEVNSAIFSNDLLLNKAILDKQIVDITGRKLVRVNDIRMVSIPAGVFAVAVDVGMEGLLRRIGIDRPLKTVLGWFHVQLPSKFILWDDVEAIDIHTLNIQLSKTRSKLNTLHPSDLADIIEDLGAHAKTKLFSTLDTERAADVLEELEEKEQIQLIESLPVERAADVLEKMPANEAADLMDNLEDEKAEELLHEMEISASEEVRELLEYPDNRVGSLMTTDILSFDKNQKVSDVLQVIRDEKPDMETLYLLFVLGENETLLGTFTMRDLLLAEPDAPLEAIMHADLLTVNDNDRLDSLSEMVSKYNMLAVPVTNDDDQLEGMVVIDDIVDDLLDKRRTT